MNDYPMPTYEDLVKKRRKELDDEHHDWRVHYRRLKSYRMINDDVTFPMFLDRISESLAEKDFLDYLKGQAKAQGVLDDE